MKELSEFEKAIDEVINDEQLKELAIEIYAQDIKMDVGSERIQGLFSNKKVVDKRGEGFYCCYCKTYSQTEMAFPQAIKIIFPPSNRDEVWIIKSHYDGCMGWD